MLTIHDTIRLIKNDVPYVGMMQASGVAMESGGPGSGRHKSGITDLEKQSTMHLRRAGFKRSAIHPVGKGGAFTKMHTDGKSVHVVNLDKKGNFVHSVGKPASVKGQQGFKYSAKSSGSRKELSTYLQKKKLA